MKRKKHGQLYCCYENIPFRSQATHIGNTLTGFHSQLGSHACKKKHLVRTRGLTLVHPRLIFLAGLR